jgi:2-hydroxychromene-2-carboxylate isomerase
MIEDAVTKTKGERVGVPTFEKREQRFWGNDRQD